MGNNLRALRKARKMTQAELAQASGINRVAIAKYEAGKVEPGAKSILRLTKALGVSTDALLKGGQTDGTPA